MSRKTLEVILDWDPSLWCQLIEPVKWNLSIVRYIIEHILDWITIKSDLGIMDHDRSPSSNQLESIQYGSMKNSRDFEYWIIITSEFGNSDVDERFRIATKLLCWWRFQCKRSVVTNINRLQHRCCPEFRSEEKEIIYLLIFTVLCLLFAALLI